MERCIWRIPTGRKCEIWKWMDKKRRRENRSIKKRSANMARKMLKYMIFSKNEYKIRNFLEILIIKIMIKSLRFLVWEISLAEIVNHGTPQLTVHCNSTQYSFILLSFPRYLFPFALWNTCLLTVIFTPFSPSIYAGLLYRYSLFPSTHTLSTCLVHVRFYKTTSIITYPQYFNTLLLIQVLIVLSNSVFLKISSLLIWHSQQPSV